MRVLLVCPYSMARPGGVQGQVLGLARALRARGVGAVVVAPCDGAPPEPGVIDIGRSIPFAANGSVAPIAPDPAAMRRTVEVIRAERPDVIHLHEPLVPGPSQATLLWGGTPSVGTFHASGRVPAYVWLRPFMRAFANRLALRTAVSPEARELAERWLGGACRVLPNGVEVDRFAKADPWPTERPAVLFVGRHEPRKGLAVLLEAFGRLPGDAVLWVAGEGPETARLRQEAPGSPARVEWLGPLSGDELARRLRGAAVLCAPSLHGESFGVVLLEAMAAGTPVVASDIAGYADVARHGREALLVPPGDAGELGRALQRVLSDGQLATELVEAGTARAATFSMDRLAERFTALYASVVESA
ncbi:MAG: glycosyltransferase family 4 protein [Acidimicrobiia bacterium]